MVIPARTGSYYGQKMSVGYLYTIAGLGTKTGSGVPAVDSELYGVSAVAIDHTGNILVAAVNDGDPRGGIRVIAAKAGTFYGQKMIKGDIYALPGLRTPTRWPSTTRATCWLGVPTSSWSRCWPRRRVPITG